MRRLIVVAAFSPFVLPAQPPAGEPPDAESAALPPLNAKPVAQTLTNENVLTLHQAGFGEDILLAKGNAASQVAFRSTTRVCPTESGYQKEPIWAINFLLGFEVDRTPFE